MNALQIAEDLIAARALIADPTHWVIGSYALDDNACPVDWASRNATCFCGDGALRRTTRMPSVIGGWDRYWTAREHLDAASLRLFKADVFVVNDGLGHAAILSVFDAAIASVGGAS